MTNQNLGHYPQQSCWVQWLEASCNTDVSVVEAMSGVHAKITFSTEEGAWSAVKKTDNSWIAPKLLAGVGYQISFCQRGVNRHGHSASPLWKESFHVHQFDEARGEAIRVGTSCSSPGHCWVSVWDLVNTVLLKYYEKFKITKTTLEEERLCSLWRWWTRWHVEAQVELEARVPAAEVEGWVSGVQSHW